MKQRTATVTSCERTNPVEPRNRETWSATGTIERLGFELFWRAEKRNARAHWEISLDIQDYDGDDILHRNARSIVLDGDPDWRRDVQTVLAPYPVQIA